MRAPPSDLPFNFMPSTPPTHPRRTPFAAAADLGIHSSFFESRPTKRGALVSSEIGGKAWRRAGQILCQTKGMPGSKCHFGGWVTMDGKSQQLRNLKGGDGDENALESRRTKGSREGLQRQAAKSFGFSGLARPESELP